MQVATLFRESATLLGASMEAGELHGLKMHGFPEGTLKQDTPTDDGYETGVDHFDIRTPSQAEQGKMNQASIDHQQMQSGPQVQPLHHSHHQHHRNVALEHRLLMRHPQENHQMGSVEPHLDNRLSEGGRASQAPEGDLPGPPSEGEGRLNGSEGGQQQHPRHESHIGSIDGGVSDRENPRTSIETNMGNMRGRLPSRDSRILNNEINGGGNGNHINAMAAHMSDGQVVNHSTHEPVIANHENHMVSVDNRLGHENHLNNLDNRLVAHGSHLAGLDSTIEHNIRLNSLGKRLTDRENHLGGLDTRINGLDSPITCHDGHLPGLQPRLLDHENHLLDARTMDTRDNHIPPVGSHEDRLNGMETRLAHQSHGHLGGMDPRDPILNPHGDHITLHMPHMGPHDHLSQNPIVQGLHHAHHPHSHHLHHSHRPHHPHQHPHPHPHSKCDSIEDPYSFVEDDPVGMGGPPHAPPHPRSSPVMLQTLPKKRGRKKKIKPEDGLGDTMELLKKENGLLKPFKERKKHDRFNGMPEEEVVKRTLPDHLTTNLDIVIIGINPGLFAAYKGHHYAGPGNHFWKCLYLSGLTPEPMTADDDYKLLSVGIGFTNMVARATKGSADLTRKEIKEGSQILLEKLQKFKPKIAVFNGKLIYEVFSGNKDFNFGRQPDFVDGTNTYMWVMPSSSARCAQLPRAADKVPFYAALKKFRDYLNGLISELDENEVVFNDQKLKTFYENDVKMENKDDQGNYYPYSRLTGSELTDLSHAVVKKEAFDPSRPEKKKRGRPKKIRTEGEETPAKEKMKKEKPLLDEEVPKKKRGRPKKIKPENGGMTEPRMASQNVPVQNGVLNEHTSSSNPASTCFSPPIQSPSGFCQGFSPAYASQAQNSVPQQYNPRAPSPAYHPSPLPTQYSQSPPPASQSQSQPFTHSDLSSEISAAISSEHLGSPPPTSPSLGPPDFEPPTSMPDDTPATMSVKEEPEQDCRFSSPAPSESTYQYRGFTDAPEMEHKAATSQYQRQPSPDFAAKRTNQDVASKSLSGLESLVDQIPSIAEGGSTSSNVVNSEGFEPQHSGQYDDYLGYPGYSTAPTAPTPQSAYPHYTSASNYSSPGYLPPSQTSFSVSSLANSASHPHEPQVPSSFAVSSLASNYPPGGYPNLMTGPHLVVPQPSLFPTGMNMTPNYQYPAQYPTPAPSFPYSPHALHVPSPNYPPYGPYSNSSYPQPYLANHVLDRIKQERMDIGFSGF